MGTKKIDNLRLSKNTLCLFHKVAYIYCFESIGFNFSSIIMCQKGFTLPAITAVVSIDWLVVSGSIGGKMDIGGATVVTSSVDAVVGTTNTILVQSVFK